MPKKAPGTTMTPTAKPKMSPRPNEPDALTRARARANGTIAAVPARAAEEPAAVRHVPGRPGPKTVAERTAAQAEFLRNFAVAGNITAACRVAQIARSSLYEWLEHDEAFSIRYHQAREEAADVLEAAAFARAVKGVERYVVSAGRVVRDEKTGRPLIQQEYSDMLLLNLLRAHSPKFKQSSRIELSGPDGGPIEVRNDARARLLEQLERLGAARGAAGPDAAAAGEGGRPAARGDRRAPSR